MFNFLRYNSFVVGGSAAMADDNEFAVGYARDGKAHMMEAEFLVTTISELCGEVQITVTSNSSEDGKTMVQTTLPARKLTATRRCPPYVALEKVTVKLPNVPAFEATVFSIKSRCKTLGWTFTVISADGSRDVLECCMEPAPMPLSLFSPGGGWPHLANL